MPEWTEWVLAVVKVISLFDDDYIMIRTIFLKNKKRFLQINEFDLKMKCPNEVKIDLTTNNMYDFGDDEKNDFRLFLGHDIDYLEKRVPLNKSYKKRFLVIGDVKPVFVTILGREVVRKRIHAGYYHVHDQPKNTKERGLICLDIQEGNSLYIYEGNGDFIFLNSSIRKFYEIMNIFNLASGNHNELLRTKFYKDMDSLKLIYKSIYRIDAISIGVKKINEVEYPKYWRIILFDTFINILHEKNKGWEYAPVNWCGFLWPES